MLAALALSATLASSTAACESLKAIVLPNTTIVAAEMVSAAPSGASAGRPGGAPVGAADAPATGRGRGAPGPGRGGRGGAPVDGRGSSAGGAQVVPAHCRIDAILRPSSDSEIEMEAWLPDEWNGKFEFVGGGGWAGTISTPAMVSAIQEGYATASTDTGHKGGNALFAINHPEKLVDFAYRAVHETTVRTKALIAKYYARAPQLSYWNGCSTGGRQGLMEAQKYPDDFDAVLAGAPANYQTHLHAWDLSVAVPVVNDPAAAVPPATLATLHQAVLNACDATDGVKDGLITNPRACRFDPATLLCKGAASDSCLTAPQLVSVKRAYGTTMTKAGEVVFPGKEFGSELGWGAFIAATSAPAISIGSFQVAYNDANWDAQGFDLERDLSVVDEKVGTIINAIDPDLSVFKARGGKLILYHGWEDTAISPGNTVNYYESVLKKMGANQDNFVRLFMVPGMQHCGGGDGPNPINYMAALERWREGNVAPDSLLAARVANNRVDMTRPICAYPKVATYTGKGSTNDAANFVCRESAK